MISHYLALHIQFYPSSPRSEIAWRDAKYAQIYEYLREEYEVAQRFGNLDFKLKFVEVLLPRQAFLMHMLDMVPAKL